MSFTEFLSVSIMRCGIYRLAQGATDMQSSHDEDEMNYLLEDKASIRVHDERGERGQSVGPGTLVYVGAWQEHAFF